MPIEVPQDIEDAIQRYKKDELLRGTAERTLETYESDLRYTFNYLGCSLEELDKSGLKELLYHLQNEKKGRRGDGVSDQTINVYFSALNSLYEFLSYEEDLEHNPIPAFRKRYLQDKTSSDGEERQLISVSEMAGLVLSVMKTRDKAVILLFAKTGVRRNELIDLQDIDWEEQSIKLKPTAKRTNQIVFFDDECARVLKKWINIRNEADPETDALFINQENDRLQRHGIYSVVTKHAEKIGLHNPDADRLDEKFTPHCCRHWFTTHLRRSGMKREYLKELRGDSREVDPMESYNHIDREELREAYLTHIPQLNL
jgi:integrase/recombinase XerD